MDELFVDEQKRKAAKERYQKWTEQKKIEDLGGGDKLSNFADAMVNKLNEPVYQI